MNNKSEIKEAQKIYNKTYYEKNKKELLQKQLTKIECPLCNRMVAHMNLATHQQKRNCKNGMELKKKIAKFDSEIEKFKKVVDDDHYDDFK